MPVADPLRKRVSTGSPASDGPHSQTMSRFSTSHNSSPSHQRHSPSAFTFSATGPPSPLSLKQHSLASSPKLSTVTLGALSPSSGGQFDFTSASTATNSSVRSLLSRLSAKRDTRQWVASTPKGADALRFRHFCPICYRHFATILATSCCAHNICHECATSYLQAKLPNYLPLAFLPADVMPCACPTCNQQRGVRFIRVANTSSGRSYVESPRTAALVRQHEHETEMESQQNYHDDQVEGMTQLQQEGQSAQQSMAVMA